MGTKSNPTFSDKIICNDRYKKKTYLWDDIYFSPVYLSILVRILNQLIHYKCRGIFHISSNQCISKYNLGKKILKKFNSNKILTPSSFNKKNFTNRPLNMCLSNNKLIKKFPIFKKQLDIEYQLNLYKKEYLKNAKKD